MDVDRDTASAKEAEWDGLPEFRCSSIFPIAMLLWSNVPVDTGVEESPVSVADFFAQSEDFQSLFCERIQSLVRLVFPMGAPASLTRKAANLAAWVFITWQIDRCVPDLLEALDAEWRWRSSLNSEDESNFSMDSRPKRRFVPLENILDSLRVPEEPLDLNGWIRLLHRDVQEQEPAVGPVGMNF